ncbi:MAG: helix-turn-helix domain-containing protein [Hyphomicrobiaceae bacterium]
MDDRASDGRTKTAVGERLRLTREALGIAQNDFSSRAGITSNAYNQYEKGVNLPSLDAAHSLCDEYQLTLDWIYRGDPSGLRYQLASAIKALRAVRR